MNKIVSSRFLRKRLLSVYGAAASIFALSTSAHPEGWNVSEISQPDQVAALCPREVSAPSEPADRAIRFTQADAAVHVCYQAEASFDPADVQRSKYRYSYEVKYALKKDANTSVLHSEAEMMAWAMDHAVYKDSLVFFQYWSTRKVKKHVFFCGKECQLKTQCRAERLPADVKDVVASVKPFLKTAGTRSQFLIGEVPRSQALLDQLFITAAMGDDKAMKTLYRLAEGMDAAAAEIIGTYIDYATELQKEKCSWE